VWIGNALHLFPVRGEFKSILSASAGWMAAIAMPEFVVIAEDEDVSQPDHRAVVRDSGQDRR